MAAGSDGGGSIRIPASFCGLVGLKPTFGRISAFGQQSFVWSLNHLGPLAATAADAALAYAVMAGPDPKDPLSMHQPAPTLEGWDKPDLSDLVLGVYWPWFRHANVDTVSACEALLKAFENMGAQVREIAIPDLEAGRIAHMITIVGEMAQALGRYQGSHHGRLGADARVALAVGRAYTSRDYIQAQRVRTRMTAHFTRNLEQVDMIITPATPCPAPAIPRAALTGGDLDMTMITEVMRFVTPANLTGLPAISFPAGYNDAGLPIGMQAMGRAWQEHTLLRLALAAERIVHGRAPQIHHEILGDRVRK
jgi:Asp-tRNA(Asn)/Glu-tRNA(Gln) amidotransferase A subunit family amidase